MSDILTLIAQLRARDLLDLDQRIHAMARRWVYTEQELRIVLEGARADPAAWLLLVEIDEQTFGTGERIAILREMDEGNCQ